MFRFEHPIYLYGLLVLIPLFLLFLFSIQKRKRKLAQFGTLSLLEKLMPEISTGKQKLKFFMLCLAYIFLILGIANPQLGTKQEKVKRAGIDLVIALDVSKSMLAEDVQPSRLARSKNFISNFLDELKNDRLGIIIFAGRAYLQMPLTVDYSAAKMYLKSINTDLVPTQGTNIAEAVDLAKESFAKGDNKSKALVIISDGEDNETGADEAVVSAAKEGIKVFTIGVGTDKGSPIPMPDGDFKRDENGTIVLSKTNQEALRALALKGDGKFFMMGSGKEEIQAILKELGKIATKDFEEVVFTDFDDKFQYCLLVAFVLLIAEILLSEKKSFWWEKLKL